MPVNGVVHYTRVFVLLSIDRGMCLSIRANDRIETGL